MDFEGALRAVEREDGRPGTAEADIVHQVDRCDGYAISLHSMWRAVGSPPGGEPEWWIRPARPLVEGLAGVYSHLDKDDAHLKRAPAD